MELLSQLDGLDVVGKVRTCKEEGVGEARVYVGGGGGGFRAVVLRTLENGRVGRSSAKWSIAGQTWGQGEWYCRLVSCQDTQHNLMELQSQLDGLDVGGKVSRQ